MHASTAQLSFWTPGWQCASTRFFRCTCTIAGPLVEWALIKTLFTTTGSSPQLGKRRNGLLVVLLALAAAASAIPPYLTHLAAGMNSDLLILPDLYDSLVLRGQSWSSWALGGALFLVPDVVVHFPLAFLLGDGVRAFLLQTALWAVLLWGGFILLGRARVGRHTTRGLGWVLLLFILATHTRVWPQAAEFWQVLYHPMVHGGGYLLVVGSMLLVFGYLRKGRPWTLGLLALACVSGTVSDLLYCVYFTLPCLFSLAALAVLHPNRRRRVPAPVVVIILSTVLARILLPWLVPSSHAENLYVNRTGVATAWNTAVFMAGDLLEHKRWMFLASALATWAAGAWLAMRLVWIYRKSRRISWRACYLDLSTLTALVGGWAAILATGNYVDGGSWRYLIFPSTLVLVMALWNAAPAIPRWAGVLGVVVSLGLGSIHGYSFPNLDRPYPAMARFLDRFNQDPKPLVLGDYWTARRTTFLCRGGIRVEQISSNGKIYHWVNSLESYERIPQAPASSTLVIMDGLDPVLIRAAYGEPTEQQTVDGSLVFVYGPQKSGEIARFITENLRQHRSR